MPATPSRWTTLVTGGCGHLGRALCQKLLGLGHHLVLLDAMHEGLPPERWLGAAVTERSATADSVTYRLAGHTLGGPSTLVWVRQTAQEALHQAESAPIWGTEALRARPIEAVFHLGAAAGHAASPSARLAATLQDLADDAALMGWMRREQTHIKRFVCVSGASMVRAPAAMGDVEVPEQAQSQLGAPWARDSAEALRIRQAEALTRALAQSTRIATSCARVAAIVEGPDRAPLSPAQRNLDEMVHALLRTSENIKDGATVALA